MMMVNDLRDYATPLGSVCKLSFTHLLEDRVYNFTKLLRRIVNE